MMLIYLEIRAETERTYINGIQFAYESCLVVGGGKKRAIETDVTLRYVFNVNHLSP